MEASKKIGWSSTAILCSLIVGLCIIIVLLGTGLRRYPSTMPIASTCSAAISARCHRLPDESPDAVRLPLKYGAAEDVGYDGRKRAAFSSGDVSSLVAGEYYDARTEG